MSSESRREESLTAGYVGVAGVVVPFLVVLTWMLRRPASVVSEADPLLPAMFSLVALTIGVLAAAAVVRNVAVMHGTASMGYYETYDSAGLPAEWIERPSRTYDNLLQIPVLFYVVCLLMMVTGRIDSVQVSLCWLFVATRFLHAFVYIAFNRVPYRFATFLCGVITLSVIWGRFAAA